MKYIYYFFINIMLTNCQLYAQLPKLVKNIGPGSSHGINLGWVYPNTFPVLNGRAVFWGSDELSGTELWVSDGSSNGTHLLKDIVAGPESPDLIIEYYKQNDRGIYFVIDIGGFKQVWFTDGTSENTRKLFIENETHKLDRYHPIGFNKSAIVFNNLFIMGTVNESDGLKSCIYRLEPENEYNDPSAAILWKDEFPIGFFNQGILEICEYQGSLISVAKINNEEGLLQINRDNGAANWILKTVGTIYHLSNVTNGYLAFRYPDAENSLACLTDLNGSIQILTTPGEFSTPLTDAQNSLIVGNKVYFYKDQLFQKLWVTDGTSNGTRPAPFKGVSRLLGEKANSLVVLLQDMDDGNYSLIKWGGGDNYEIISNDQGILTPNIFSYFENGDTEYLISHNLIRLINGRSYKYFGVPDLGDSTKVNFSFSAVNKFGSNLFLSGLNNSLYSLNALGIEPYLFSLTNKVWTGSFSKNWHDPLNWYPEGVPSSTDDIIIPETPNSNYPILLEDGECKSLFINYGSITISENIFLQVNGELSNYSIINGPGILKMEAGNQAIITGPGEYTFNSLQFISGNYYLADESKTINSNILLGSNAKLFLNDYDLNIQSQINQPIEGFSSSSYIVSNGLGVLSIQNNNLEPEANQQQVFPIGLSSFNPVTINRNGSPAKFSIRVLDEAFENGIEGNIVSTSNLKRTWEINKGSIDNIGIDVLFQWQTPDELPDFNKKNCFVRHYVNGSWQNSNPGNSISLPNGLHGKELKNILSFSPFTISSNLGVLPVRLISFRSVTHDNNLIELKWITDNEVNVSHFEVQHSNLPNQFIKIGELKPNNIFSQTKDYSFSHLPNKSKNYYRIKIIDKDGSFEYSNIVLANIKIVDKLIVFPNPAINFITINSGNTAINYLLIKSLNGRVLKNIILSSPVYRYQFDVSWLSKGVYNLIIGNDEGEQVKMIIKQ